MALVNLKTILNSAKQGGYAVPAFNVYNLETVSGVVSAAQKARSPVILQCYARLFKEGSAFYLAPSILNAAVNSDVPICFHLDHGNGDTELMRALRYGCTGVMTDGSLLPFEENVALTKRTVSLSAPSGVSVEGELGHIGATSDAEFSEFTDPREAETFVRETGVDALAILVGTAHGRYKKSAQTGYRSYIRDKQNHGRGACASRRQRRSRRGNKEGHQSGNIQGQFRHRRMLFFPGRGFCDFARRVCDRSVYERRG